MKPQIPVLLLNLVILAIAVAVSAFVYFRQPAEDSSMSSVGSTLKDDGTGAEEDAKDGAAPDDAPPPADTPPASVTP